MPERREDRMLHTKRSTHPTESTLADIGYLAEIHTEPDRHLILVVFIGICIWKDCGR